jgi:hypothetical protein
MGAAPRQILAVLLSLLVVMTGALQAGRAALETSAAPWKSAAHKMADRPLARHGRHHDHAAVVPVAPKACLLACLDALPDQYLVGKQVRISAPSDLHAYALIPDLKWVALKRPRFLPQLARGPPIEFESAALRTESRNALLHTQRLRI